MHLVAGGAGPFRESNRFQLQWSGAASSARANRAMRGRTAAEHSLQANKSSSVGFTACGDKVCWFNSAKRMEDGAMRVTKCKRTSLDKLRDTLFNERQPDTLQT